MQFIRNDMLCIEFFEGFEFLEMGELMYGLVLVLFLVYVWFFGVII